MPLRLLFNAVFLSALLAGFAVLSGCGRHDAPGKSADAHSAEGNQNATTDSKATTTALDVASSVSLYTFDLEQLIQLQSRALNGDGDAAYKLSEYYSLRKQWFDADQWTRIGAENGHPISAELLAKTLWDSGGFHNCQRAMFWLGRAKTALEKTSEMVKMRMLDATIADIGRDETRCLWSELRGQ